MKLQESRGIVKEFYFGFGYGRCIGPILVINKSDSVYNLGNV